MSNRVRGGRQEGRKGLSKATAVYYLRLTLPTLLASPSLHFHPSIHHRLCSPLLLPLPPNLPAPNLPNPPRPLHPPGALNPPLIPLEHLPPRSKNTGNIRLLLLSTMRPNPHICITPINRNPPPYPPLHPYLESNRNRTPARVRKQSIDNPPLRSHIPKSPPSQPLHPYPDLPRCSL